MVVTAKLSDTVGRKPMVMFSVAVFTVFSGGCGAARTMNELQVPSLYVPKYQSTFN